MSGEMPEPGRRRRVPTGALILAGSVLASFVWWMLMPRDAARPVEPTVPAVEAPAPADAPAEKPAPAPVAPPAERRAPRAASEPRPAPVEPARPAGPTLRVSGDVEGADVFVDRTFAGKTPFETTDITPGPHQINISSPGHDGVSERIEVAATGRTEMTFSLKAVRLDVTADVVHKHGMGSCEGRLSATPAGITFTPAEGRDGFTAPLTSLEQFSVDYQEKLLRVKVKGGRTFNFTTRAANADPLFVFHRDVEKARAKLAGGA
jgi:hypothetical protein